MSYVCMLHVLATHKWQPPVPAPAGYCTVGAATAHARKSTNGGGVRRRRRRLRSSRQRIMHACRP